MRWCGHNGDQSTVVTSLRCPVPNNNHSEQNYTTKIGSFSSSDLPCNTILESPVLGSQIWTLQSLTAAANTDIPCPIEIIYQENVCLSSEGVCITCDKWICEVAGPKLGAVYICSAGCGIKGESCNGSPCISVNNRHCTAEIRKDKRSTVLRIPLYWRYGAHPLHLKIRELCTTKKIQFWLTHNFIQKHS